MIVTRNLMKMKIAVFCSANSDIDAGYFKAAGELGRWIGENGHTLVFGGCNLGLMQCVAEAVHKAGGRTIGVVPAIIERGGKASPDMDVCIPCDNLSDRKDLMLAQADVCVALPGGIGTLDEVFTVAASASIGYHPKRVVIYNVNGFWDSLTAMLSDLKGKGVIRKGFDNDVCTASTLSDVVRLIEQS